MKNRGAFGAIFQAIVWMIHDVVAERLAQSFILMRVLVICAHIATCAAIWPPPPDEPTDLVRFECLQQALIGKRELGRVILMEAVKIIKTELRCTIDRFILLVGNFTEDEWQIAIDGAVN